MSVHLNQSACLGHHRTVPSHSTEQIDAGSQAEHGGPVHLERQHVERPEGGVEASRDARLAEGVGQYGPRAAEELVADMVGREEDALQQEHDKTVRHYAEGGEHFRCTAAVLLLRSKWK